MKVFKFRMFFCLLLIIAGNLGMSSPSITDALNNTDNPSFYNSNLVIHSPLKNKNQDQEESLAIEIELEEDTCSVKKGYKISKPSVSSYCASELKVISNHAINVHDTHVVRAFPTLSISVLYSIFLI